MFAQSKSHLLFAKKLQQSVTYSLRWKAGPNHWKNLEKKNKPIHLALNHFDDFYKNVFGKKWHSIRLGLLCPHKYCAIVNNYSDTEKIISSFENEGAFNLRNLFELQANKLTRRRKINSDEQGLDNIYKVERNLGSREKSNYEEKIVDQPNRNETDNQLLKTFT
uniref:Uncharacterized protein n=1 Tax=Clastoptera arizonana TaxID=38151 RepID=A0A1B6DJC8_9HEMI